MTAEHMPQGLRSRLLQRVAQSHAHESQFTTWRRDQSDWVTATQGVRVLALPASSVASLCLVELEAGARFAMDARRNQWEAVVLAGAASIGGMNLRCGDAGVGWAAAEAASIQGARIFLRQSHVDEPGSRPRVISTLDDADWHDFVPGVRIRELCNGGERRSVLVRMRAGATVNAHGHPLEEECMMLAGEAFIGDTLLRSGEFQIAPQGSRHGAISTDVGALFYVHGSLDPSAYV